MRSPPSARVHTGQIAALPPPQPRLVRRQIQVPLGQAHRAARSRPRVAVLVHVATAARRTSSRRRARLHARRRAVPRHRRAGGQVRGARRSAPIGRGGKEYHLCCCVFTTRARRHARDQVHYLTVQIGLKNVHQIIIKTAANGIWLKSRKIIFMHSTISQLQSTISAENIIP